jgi:hypothetical protein
MGLFGNLFTESETSRNIEKLIENDTNLRNEIVNINKNLSSQVSNIMMTSMQEMAAGQDITQQIRIKGIKAKDDININTITQTVKVKVNLSALQNTKLQNEMLEKIQSNLSQGLKEAIENVQTKENIKGEQWVSELAGFANNLVNTVAGGDLDENIKETTKNTLNSENIQKTINEISTNVESNINNQTMAKIAASFSADQAIEISDIEAGANATISNVEQEVLVEQLLKSVQDTGAGANLVSDILGISKSFTERVIKTEQKVKDETKSTLSGISDIFQGQAGIVGAIVSMVASSVCLSMIFGLVILKGKQVGGGNLLKFTKLSEFQIILIIAIAIILLLTMRENFTKTENVVLKNGNKYIYPNGDKLCLTSDKQLAGAFNLKIINVDNKPNTVLIEVGDKFLRKVGDQLLLRKYDLFDKEMHDFKINKLSETTFELSKDEIETISIKDECLVLINSGDKLKIDLE